MRRPSLHTALLRHWKHVRPPKGRAHVRALAEAVALLARHPAPAHRLALPEQPFDRELLALSPLFRRGRELFHEHGGRFEAALISSPRTLSSPTLLSPLVQYSPVASELTWAATDRIQRRRPEHLLAVRAQVCALFHEQNHRVLWKLLPPAPRDAAGLRRYLHFAEALVITLDMALGDELGQRLSTLFYMTGVTYDPGTGLRAEGVHGRAYRNYLQAALHATYLHLEHYDPKAIPVGICSLFPGQGDLAERAARRSGNLDRDFVWKTSPAWRKLHGRLAAKVLGGPASRSFQLPDDPMDNRLQYLMAERCFDLFGL